MNRPLTANQLIYYEPLFQKVAGLCAEFEIDPTGPRAFELLVRAFIEEAESEFARPETVPARRKPPPPGPGAPYRSALADEVILDYVGRELAEMRASGLKPTIRGAARRLAAWPYFLGMSAETIRKRHAEILRRLRRGEPLQPELQKLINQLFADRVNTIRRQARARQDEKKVVR